MEIKTMSGHLTQTNKVHIKAMMEKNLTHAKVNRITYQIEKIRENFFKVTSMKVETTTIGADPKPTYYSATFIILK